mmetsp:Transcript_18714/g.42736  ORF Transcript_18714/g.42736 Transcript_18714/m.42736 type:complete len:106 (+) Transcript_18714:782-1099(+)
MMTVPMYYRGVHYFVDNSVGFFIVASKESFNMLGFKGIKTCQKCKWQVNLKALPALPKTKKLSKDSLSDSASDSSSDSDGDQKKSPEADQKKRAEAKKKIMNEMF